MAVRIMDDQFNFLGEIDDYEQLVFQRNFVSFGDFEMIIDKNKTNTQHLRQGNILFIDKRRAGYIEHMEITQNAVSERILVKGFTLEKLLSYRITEPPVGSAEWSLKAPAETVIKALLDFNLGQTAKNERRINEIVIAPNAGRGDVIEFKTAYKPLDEEIKSICMNNGMGISMVFDTVAKRFVFDVLFGKDLTALQTSNPPVIFCSEFDNILEQTLIVNTMDYKNTAITGGKGEGANREIIIQYEDGKPFNGLSRREVFADIRDSGVTSETLPEKGKEKLSEYPRIFTLDGKINPLHSVVFGKDYDLGDIVTRRYGNTTLDTRITEVVESWSADGYELSCTFGNKMPTLLDKIKNGVSVLV